MSDYDLKLDTACKAAHIILENGGETYRAEETAEKMCEGFGFAEADVLALPTGIILTAHDNDGLSYTRVTRVKQRRINLSAIDMCNQISRTVHDRGIDAVQASRKLSRITAQYYKTYVKIAACALSCAFFTLMLGGRHFDAAVSLLCGLLLQSLVPLMARWHIPTMISSLLSSAFVTVLALIGEKAIPVTSVESIISGSIMPLLPGLAITNAIRDMLRGDLVSGGARTMEAITTALMIAAGVGLTLVILGG